MPTMDLTYPAGALTPDAKATLDQALTTVLLRAEGAPDNDFFRSVTWLFHHVLPQTDVVSAGAPAAAPLFRLEVTTPQGALSDRRRKQLVTEATAAIREAAGIPEDEALRVWVLCREIDEGSWGAGGYVVEFEQLKAAAKAQREAAAVQS